MRVFISWSGEKSKAAAIALRDWLPKVIQALDCWMSEADIDAGKTWNREIRGTLEACDFGVACVTKSNHEKPWLLFETGAIAKKVSEGYVIPYLIDYSKPSELPPGPLTQFQAVVADKEGTRKLIHALNNALGENRRDDIDDLFGNWWPRLESGLKGLPNEDDEPRQERSSDDVQDEILSIVRRLDRSVASNVGLPIREDDTKRRMSVGLHTLESAVSDLRALSRRGKFPQRISTVIEQLASRLLDYAHTASRTIQRKVVQVIDHTLQVLQFELEMATESVSSEDRTALDDFLRKLSELLRRNETSDDT